MESEPLSPPSIVIRVGRFPTKSETFVTLQARIISELGYQLSLLVDKKESLVEASQPDILRTFDMLDKCVELGRTSFNGGRDQLSTLVAYLSSGAPFRAWSSLNPFRHGLPGLRGSYALEYKALKGQEGGDIFHIQFGVYSAPLVSLKKQGLLDAKLICTFHGFDAHYDPNNLALRQAEYADLFKYAHFITANTKFLADKLSTLGCPREKLRVLHMPVDVDFFVPNDRRTDRELIRIVSVGRLIPLKGHRYAIEAMSLLKQSKINFEYHIIGTGEQDSNLFEQVKIAGLESQVILRGALDQDEIRRELQEADLFVMSSVRDEDGREEAQGIVSLEAQSCGVPVVAFKSGGVPYTLEGGRTGLLAEEKDVAGMANHLETLIANPARRREMGIAARTFVQNKFSYSVIKEQWRQIYSELLKDV